MRTLKPGLITVIAIGLLAGSAVGVAAQDDSSPAFFSWTYGDGEAEFVPGEMDESVPGVMTMRDFTQVFSIEADDGRASGLSTYVFNSDSWADADADAPEMIDVISFSQRIVNEGGSWSGTGTLVDHTAPGEGAARSGASMATLAGESGYDGLTLFLLLTPGDEGGSGFIVPTANVPPVPELPAE